MLVAIVASTLTGVAGPLAAQVPRDGRRAPAAEVDRPSALADIDRLAVRAVTLVRSHVPDRAGTTIRVLPFATDTGAATRLGHRLQSAVHLRLLREYRSATIQVEPRRPLATPTEDGPGLVPTSARPAGHALEVEIQPFRETVRVILRVHGSGTVTAGDWIDLPVNDELQELLDGTGAGGAGTGALSGAAVPAASTSADANAGADSEPDRQRTPLPSVVTVDQGQQRYTIGGEDWVTLQVPAPGFYLLEGRSISGPLTLSAHYDRAGPPVVAAREDLPPVGNGATGGLPQSVDRVLGIFSGPQKIHARVATASDEEVAFYLRLRRMSPSRRFADGTVYVVPLERGTGFQTLRVFRSGTYRVVAEADSGAVALRVLGVPHMRTVAPISALPPGSVEPGTDRYELTAGDYLIEVTSARAGPAARLCWTAADTPGGCEG